MSTFKNEDELWNYVEKNYDEKSQKIVLDIESYYEVEYYQVEYCDIYNSDIENYYNKFKHYTEKYNNWKKKDSTGELDILAKQYFEFVKPQIDKNMNRNKTKN